MAELAKIPNRPYRSSYDGLAGDGQTVLQTPWPMSSNDLEDFEAWIALCMKTIRRASERSWVTKIHPLAACEYVGADVELMYNNLEPDT